MRFHLGTVDVRCLCFQLCQVEPNAKVCGVTEEFLLFFLSFYYMRAGIINDSFALWDAVNQLKQCQISHKNVASISTLPGFSHPIMFTIPTVAYCLYSK